jgi:hypothetical protein
MAFGDGHPFGPDRHAPSSRTSRPACTRRVRSPARAASATNCELTAFTHRSTSRSCAQRDPRRAGLSRRRRHAGLARHLRGGERRRRRTLFATEAIMAGRRAGPSCRSPACTTRRASMRGGLLRVQRLRRRHRIAALAHGLAHRLCRHRRPPRRWRVLRLRVRSGADLRRYPRGRSLPLSGHGCGRGDGRAPRPAPSSTFRCRRVPGDEEFRRAWPRVDSHLERFAPEFIILQCGADSLEGDPDHPPALSPGRHAHAAADLTALADASATGACWPRAAAATTAATSPGLDCGGRGLRRGGRQTR